MLVFRWNVQPLPSTAPAVFLDRTARRLGTSVGQQRQLPRRPAARVENTRPIRASQSRTEHGWHPGAERRMGFCTTNGNARRGNGILNNEIYIGRLVWNRQRFIRIPTPAGARRGRTRWRTGSSRRFPIVVSSTRTSGRQPRRGRPRSNMFALTATVARTSSGTTAGRNTSSPAWRDAPDCGGGYSTTSDNPVDCSTARNKGTCDNRTNIRERSKSTTLIAHQRSAARTVARNSILSTGLSSKALRIIFSRRRSFRNRRSSAFSRFASDEPFRHSARPRLPRVDFRQFKWHLPVPELEVWPGSL